MISLDPLVPFSDPTDGSEDRELVEEFEKIKEKQNREETTALRRYKALTRERR